MRLNRYALFASLSLLIAFATALSAQLTKPFAEQSPTGFTLSTSANCGRGNKFHVNVDGQAVYQLGAWYPDTTSIPRPIRLWDMSNQTMVAETTTPSGAGWQWGDLAAPVPLVNGRDYCVTGYGNGYYYTSAAPASWVFTGNLTYLGMQYCNSCGTSKVYPTTFLGANYIYGVVDIAYGPQASEWTGANSSDWNDDGNWTQGKPTFDLGAKIPDAGTTANDPILPSNDSDCKGIELATGSILVGGAGRLNLLGDWDNKGGNFVPQTSLISYTGDKDQKVITGGGAIGSIHVKNTVASLLFLDNLTAANAGTLTADLGTKMVFTGTMVNFASMTFANQGTIYLGLDGGGTVATTQSITTTAGKNLGNVDVKVLDAMDYVEFLGSVDFDSLTLSGNGSVTFYGAMNVTTNFTTNMGGVLSAAAIGGTANLNFDMSAPLTITGLVSGKDLNHTGTGDLTINGAVNLTGNANFASLGPLTVATMGGAFNAIGNLTVDPAFSGAGDAVTFGGNVSIDGNASFLRSSASLYGIVVQDALISTTGTVTYCTGGNADFGTLNVSGTATATGNQNLYIRNSLLTTGSCDFLNTGATVFLYGQVTHASTGNFEIGGTIQSDGASSGTQRIQAGTTGITSGRIYATNNSNLIIEGRIALTRNGTGAAQRTQVDSDSGITLEPNGILQLGSPGGFGQLNVQGAFTTTGGISSIAPRIVGGAAAGEHAHVRFRTGSRVNLDGVYFENVGPNSQAYGVRIEAGSDVLAFNHIRMTDARSTTAAFELSTASTPKVFTGFNCAGQSPGNIDATNVSGVRIEVKEAMPLSGNLYGAGLEVDPNGVLYWENPPVVDITSAQQLPNALAENPFSFLISAVGGNQPLTWSVANHPSFLSINAITGELRGTPTRNHIGTHVFVVIASDGSQPSLSASKVFTLVVDSLTSVGITIVTPPDLITGRIGENYRYALAAAGGTATGYKWYLVNPNGLPAGLFLDSNTGEIFGMPAANAAGIYNVPIRVEDPQGNSTIKSFSMTIHTEFSNPALISSALSDGPGGGGCAMTSDANWLILAGFMALLAMVALRRRDLA